MSQGSHTSPNPDPRGAAFTLLEGREFEKARQRFAAMVQRAPNDGQLRLGLADSCKGMGDHAAALFHAERAIKGCGGHENLYVKCAQTIAQCGKPYVAVDLLREACENNPTWSEGMVYLANLYTESDNLADGEDMLRRALKVNPEMINARHSLAHLLGMAGRSSESLAIYRDLVWRHPTDLYIMDSMAYQMNLSDGPTPQEVFQTHVRLGLLFADSTPTMSPFKHPPTDDPDRKLTLGFVTHDFRGHSVSFFLEPLLAHLDRERFRVIVYYTFKHRDYTTARMGSLVDKVVMCDSIHSADLAKVIHDDKVDLLFDLNGWTLGHRLYAFQLRPAPVQLTLIGYPNTTGIPNMDYRVVDSVTDPPGADAYATETLLRLDPSFLCYSPVTTRPGWIAPEWKPPERAPLEGRSVVFGTFNNAAKISDSTLLTWKRILDRNPDSTLLIKGRGLHQDGARRAFEQRLRGADLPFDRCRTLQPTPGTVDHLAVYSQVDIALDTFPYNGTTTTCESLLMGVPVITARGDRHVSRVGASLLTNVGCQDLIADTLDQYVEIATALAADKPRLAELHRTLSERFLRSPICDGPGYARAFGELMRRAWRTRCEHGVGPEARRRFVQ